MAEDQALVIGVGNQYRGDDAVGLVVAERLKQLQLPNVSVTLCPGGGLDLMDAWQNAQSVIIVDAVRSNEVAGSVVRVSHEDLDRLNNVGTVSSHGFGVVEAVSMATALGILPAKLVIYGIEAQHFEPGTVMSPDVAAAVDQVVQIIAEELQCTSLA